MHHTSFTHCTLYAVRGFPSLLLCIVDYLSVLLNWAFANLNVSYESFDLYCLVTPVVVLEFWVLFGIWEVAGDLDLNCEFDFWVIFLRIYVICKWIWLFRIWWSWDFILDCITRILVGGEVFVDNAKCSTYWWGAVKGLVFDL